MVYFSLTHQQPAPSQPERTILGQPRPGVEPGPRPEPDAEHPFGPIEYDQRSKSPQPIRTSVKYQANPGSNANGQNKARFGMWSKSYDLLRNNIFVTV